MTAPKPMPENSRSSYRKILHAIDKRGTTLGRWARLRGYQRRTVYMTVHRWADRTDKAPQGRIARQIMSDLRADLGPEIVPHPRESAKNHPPQEKAA